MQSLRTYSDMDRYETGRVLNGVIFLHRISDPRVGGAALKNITRFKKLCGEDAYRNIRIVTNMWEDVPQELGEARQAELKSDPAFFGDLLVRGAVLMRHDGSKKSAERIVGSLIGLEGEALQIQRELVDENKTLPETEVGVSLSEELEKQQRKFQDEIDGLKGEITRLANPKDGRYREEIEELQADLEKVKEQMGKVTSEKQVLADTNSEETKRQEERMRILAETMDAKELEFQKLRKQLEEQNSKLEDLAREKEAAAKEAALERALAETIRKDEAGKLMAKLEADKREANSKFESIIESQRQQIESLRAELGKDGEHLGEELGRLQAALGDKKTGEDQLRALSVALEDAQKKAEAHRKEAELENQASKREVDERIKTIIEQHQAQLDELQKGQEAQRRKDEERFMEWLQAQKNGDGEMQERQENDGQGDKEEWSDVGDSSPKGGKRGARRRVAHTKVAGTVGQRPAKTVSYQEIGAIMDMLTVMKGRR